MDASGPWRWIWLAAMAGFAIGEAITPGLLVLAPFAVGAAVAAVLAFADASLAWQWGAFVVGSALAVGACFPIRHRLDRNHPQDGVGSRRLLGELAQVVDAVPAGHAQSGLVRVGREEWRAESLDGRAIPAGAIVKVVEVKGTRVLVFPNDGQPLRPPSEGDGRREAT